MTAQGVGSRHRARFRPQRTRWEMPWLLSAFLLWSAAASALGPGVLMRDLRHTAWGSKEGAPADVQALAQSRDGYLWIGNASGLYRFDGLRFERIELPRDDRLSSFNIYTLYAPRTGGLWIGFTVGTIAFLKDGHWTTYGEADGLWAGTSNHCQCGDAWCDRDQPAASYGRIEDSSGASQVTGTGGGDDAVRRHVPIAGRYRRPLFRGLQRSPDCPSPRS